MLSLLCASRPRWSSATTLGIPLLLLLRLLICCETFSPPHTTSLLEQHAQRQARVKVQLNNSDPLMLKIHHRNTHHVLSVLYSPVLLQLAADDKDNIIAQEQEEDENQQRSLIRRVLTIPLRLLKRPIRYLRRKIGKGEGDSNAQQDEGGGYIMETSAAKTATTVATAVQTESSPTLDTKSFAVEEKKNVRNAVPKATKKKPPPLPPVGLRTGIGMDRSPTCAKSVDLSGQWDLLVTDEFKNQYDEYLTLLGQPYLVRSVAISIVGLTTEETRQTDSGRNLYILGRNLRGVWERNLITDEGSRQQQLSFTPSQTEIITADGENVMAEAWWEDQGTTHRSWLRGVKKYGGGDFESKRFLEKKDRNDILVCESTFHPNDPKREKAKVTWRFTRQQL
jgi:hypothetical protein